MRALVVLDSLWIVVLIAFGLVLFRDGARRAELRGEAERIHRELALVERAVERAGKEGRANGGGLLPFESYREFIDGGSKRLREKGIDSFGNPYGPQRPGQPPAVPAQSAERLREVVAPEFWEPYPVPGD